MEDIKKLFDVLKNSIEKFNEFIATWTKLLKIAKLNKFPDEMRKFRSDMSSYHLGVFLWCREEYPNISEIFSSLDIFPPIFTIKGVKEIIDEYSKFIKKIQLYYPLLFKEEYNETRNLFFNKEIKPIEMTVIKDTFMQLINDETIKIVNKFKEYVPKTNNIIKSYSESIRNSKDLISMIKAIKKVKIPIETKKLAKEITNDAKKLDEFLKIRNKEPSKEIYELLELMKSIDAFNINFVKYLNRLNHIFEQGNRNYYKNYLIYDTWPKRKKLKTFLKDKFSQDCPKLSRVLNIFLTVFIKFRNVDAHASPKIKFSKNGKYAFISQIGYDKDLRMNIRKVRELTNAYIALIEAIGIP